VIFFFLALQSIEAVGVSLHLTSQGPLSVIVAHKAPIIPLIISNLDALFETCSSVIVCGDFNCKYPAWNSQVNTPNDRILESYSDERELLVLGPQYPTHMAKTGDVLDVAVLKINFYFNGN
jgi:hypothetical protein